MEFITNHIDEILDHFPINKVTQKMRTDLLEATAVDYKDLVEEGKTEQEAKEIILNRIADANTIATMIPNKHDTFYLIYWGIAIALFIFVFSYIFNPNFLQIFLPTRMEFPDIIAKLILYFFTVSYSYALLYSFYRLLPQKYLFKTPLQSAIFLYGGTVLSALYFSVAMAFVWYTFNGFNPTSITTDLTGKFIYTFYKIFFSSNFIVIIYGFVNACLFVLSREAYHLETKPQPYVFENIYQTTVTKEEKAEDFSAAILVTEEVISYLLDY